MSRPKPSTFSFRFAVHSQNMTATGSGKIQPFRTVAEFEKHFDGLKSELLDRLVKCGLPPAEDGR